MMYNTREALEENVDGTKQRYDEAKMMMAEYDTGEYDFVCKFSFVVEEEGYSIEGQGATVVKAKDAAIEKFKEFEEKMIDGFIEEMYVHLTRSDTTYLVGVNMYE